MFLPYMNMHYYYYVMLPEGKSVTCMHQAFEAIMGNSIVVGFFQISFYIAVQICPGRVTHVLRGRALDHSIWSSSICYSPPCCYCCPTPWYWCRCCCPIPDYTYTWLYIYLYWLQIWYLKTFGHNWHHLRY